MNRAADPKLRVRCGGRQLSKLAPQIAAFDV